MRLGAVGGIVYHPRKLACTRSSREVPMCLGTRGHVAHSGSIRDSPGVSLGTRGLLGGLPKVVYGSGTRGQMASSGVIRKGSPGLGYSGTRGTLRGKDRRVTRCGFRDIRHISKGAFGLTFGTRGMFRRRFEGGFRRDGFRAGCRDTQHSPKDGPEGVSTEASKGTFGRASGLLRKGLSVGLRGHVLSSKR